jgi:LacI family transcriptional regulator/LacI family repressor for deo operon, udp, cdd, tsx, nupC, and nupG
MVTIKDIAKVANVSTATVSLVLNNSDKISRKTAEKVRKVAKELNYTPSIAAKMLKTNKTKSISVVIGDIVNPFFPEIIKGVEESARNHGYSVVIFDLSNGDDMFLDELNKSIIQRVDGHFITGVAPVSEKTMIKLREIHEAGIQIVSCNRFMEKENFPVIVANDQEQIESLLYRLLASGHKNIGCISGKPGYWVTTQRDNYYMNILKQFKLFREEYIIHEGFSFEDGQRGMRKLLTEHPEITAVMCISDTLGIGGMKEAQKMGYRIPEDLSIFSVDGIEYVKYTSPQLTTVNTHRYEYGFHGTERLIALIEGKSDERNAEQDMYFNCSITEGETIGACRNEQILHRY